MSKKFLSCSGANAAGYQIFPLRLVQGVGCFAAEVLKKVENASEEDKRFEVLREDFSERACALGMYIPCN